MKSNIPMVVNSSLNGTAISVVINAISMTMDSNTKRFLCAKTLRIGATKNGCKYVHVSASDGNRHYDLSPNRGFSVSMYFDSWLRENKPENVMSGILVIAFDQHVYIADLMAGIIVNEHFVVLAKALEIIDKHKNSAGSIYWVEGGKLHNEISNKFEKGYPLSDFIFPPTASKKRELGYTNLNWYMFRNGYWDLQHLMGILVVGAVCFGVVFLYTNYKQKAVDIIVAQQEETAKENADKLVADAKAVAAKQSSFSGAARLREFKELLILTKRFALRADGLRVISLVDDLFVLEGVNLKEYPSFVRQYLGANQSWSVEFGDNGLWHLIAKSKVEIDIRTLTLPLSNSFAPQLIHRLGRIARSPASYKLVKSNLKSGIEMNISFVVKVGIVAVLGDIADVIDGQSFSVKKITCTYPDTAPVQCEVVLNFRHLLK